MTRLPSTPCIVCGTTQWTMLPDPGEQSMASDWRIVPEPLGRVACEQCGLVCRQPSTAVGEALYASGYGLYAHAPGGAREDARQDAYARWIGSTAGRAPSRVLDIGCGNGSLLVALRRLWPEAELLGCDPSAESVAHGAEQGLQLWQGTGADVPAGVADLVIAVNVIEHTPEPQAFLEELRRAMAPGGRAVVVCPDGGTPGLELLFADHLFSFAPVHLRTLLARAGLRLVDAETAPSSLGAFQMVVAEHANGVATERVTTRADTSGRADYLDRWRRLDGRLRERVQSPAVCFGAGEAAGLLRAYAPETWRSIRACTADDVSGGMFGSLPMIPVADVSADETVLLAVRPSDQRRVAERLRSRFARIVTWYDFVDGADRAG